MGAAGRRSICIVVHALSSLWDRSQMAYSKQWREQWTGAPSLYTEESHRAVQHPRAVRHSPWQKQHGIAYAPSTLVAEAASRDDIRWRTRSNGAMYIVL
eukprot:SAG11_NODE_1175_length_5601_cov_15.947110_5_plen_99_part_00